MHKNTLVLALAASTLIALAAAPAAAEPQTDVRVWYQHVIDGMFTKGEVPPTTFDVNVPYSFAHVAGESILVTTYNYDLFMGLGATGADMRFVLDGEQICRWVFVLEPLQNEHVAGEVRCKAAEFLTGTHTVQIFMDGTPDAQGQGQTSIELLQVETVATAAAGPAQAAALAFGLVGFGGGAVAVLAASAFARWPRREALTR